MRAGVHTGGKGRRWGKRGRFQQCNPTVFDTVNDFQSGFFGRSPFSLGWILCVLYCSIEMKEKCEKLFSSWREGTTKEEFQSKSISGLIPLLESQLKTDGVSWSQVRELFLFIKRQIDRKDDGELGKGKEFEKTVSNGHSTGGSVQEMSNKF